MSCTDVERNVQMSTDFMYRCQQMSCTDVADVTYKCQQTYSDVNRCHVQMATAVMYRCQQMSFKDVKRCYVQMLKEMFRRQQISCTDVNRCHHVERWQLASLPLILRIHYPNCRKIFTIVSSSLLVL